MTGVYRIFGSEMSPYSLKVRSYFRYKNIPHEWLLRGANSEEYQKYARLPIVPTLATPDGEGLQDSTPIIERLEAQVPAPAIHPDDPTLKFLSQLIEEFGDEWGNKWMFHYRWKREVDQVSAAQRIVADMMPGAPDADKSAMVEQVQGRMKDRISVVGSNETTSPFIEQTFKDGMSLLETHLANRSYLFGERPSFADFGLSAQIYEAWTDPTAGQILQEIAPKTCEWHQRMLDPKDQGDFEEWSSLSATLSPFLKGPVRIFLTWSDANAKAISAAAPDLSVELDGIVWSQSVGGPQKYHAKSLAELRRKFVEVSNQEKLVAVLENVGCLQSLLS